MRLWTKYPNPDVFRLPANQVYIMFQPYLLKAFSEIPPVNFSSESLSDTGFEYKLSDRETEFFTKFYIPCTTNQTEKLAENIIGKTRRVKSLYIGEYAKDILEFVSADVGDPGILLLAAPIGWGKTSLLRYVFHYIVPKMSKSSEIRIIPLYFSLDRYANMFSQRDRRQCIDVLHKKN